MQNSKRVTFVAIAALAALSMSQQAAAEADRGFYIGISGGESQYDLEKSEFDVIARNAFFSQGVPVLSSSSTFEDGGTTLSVFGGYRFSPYIAVEGGYVDLGTVEHRWSGNVNPPGPVTSTPASADVDLQAKGFKIAALGSLPLGSVVDLHARLGFFVAQTDIDVEVRIGSGNGARNEPDALDSSNVFAGVGAAFHIGSHFTLSLDYSRYTDVGDDDDFFDEDDEDSGGIDVDTMTLSAIFRF